MKSKFDKDYWENRPFTRSTVTEEHIRKNQEANRRQRERELAAWNSDSAPADPENTQDKGKDTDTA